MLYWIYTIFVLLHGLVHMLFPSIAQGWVPAPPKAGDFTGTSWLFTRFLGEPGTRSLGTAAFSLVTLMFIIAAIGLAFRQDWATAWVAASAIASSLVVILMWDGRLQALDEKGFIGVLISIGLLIGLYAFKYPAL